MATIAAANNVEPSSSRENITCIDGELYKAAVKGNSNRFTNVDNIECLLTRTNKNTILHIHLTSTKGDTTIETAPSCLLSLALAVMNKTRDLVTGYKRIDKAVSKQFVEHILNKCGGLVLLPNAKGETPLHVAARYGHSTVAKMLIDRANDFPLDIESGVGVGEAKKLTRAATHNNNDTALHEAVRYHHIKVVQILLRMDPELSNIANKANETPLYLASERKYTQIVHKILEEVKSPAYGGPQHRTALHAAVINNDIEATRDFLKNEHLRATVKHADKHGRVPLHYAVKAGNELLTDLLLEQDKSTAYMKDKEGMTALHIAAYHDHDSVMHTIIRHCPDCSEIVDNKGWNALHYAVNAKSSFTMHRIMRDLSLSNLYNEKDDKGNTPLHYAPAAQNQPSEMVYYSRVDKLALNQKDQTCLDIAYEDVEECLPQGGTKMAFVNAGAKRSQRLEVKPKDRSSKLVFSEKAKESHLIVSTLIATVTFAAAFTLPGGTIQDGENKGSPILGQRASFKAFIVSNSIALALSASATFIHLFSLHSKAKWLEYDLSENAFSFILVAIAAMIVAFVTGTYAVLGSSSIGIAAITVGLSFFFVFDQVLRTSLGSPSLFAFMKNLANVIFFSYILLACRLCYRCYSVLTCRKRLR